MNKLENVFKNKKSSNIAYIVGGYPSIEYTRNFLVNLEKTPIDILEIGIPYSDPIADGKIISEASFKASQNNVTPDTIFDLLISEKENIKTPLVFLVYYNLIYAYGLDNFIKKSTEANISGLIIPDLPYEEAHEFVEKLKNNNISFIPLISVTSENRIQKLVSQGSGFIYAVASLGVTGTKQVSHERLTNFIQKIKTHTSLPVAIGFGIKSKQDITDLRGISDGVIVGTSIVKLTESNNPDEMVMRLNELF
ncbi:MAG: tryptophan synthase subunit alpha [Sebaldella sp.]|nr:tryptophan synthase subunit alpha [Sebaldella sp.]